MIGADTNVLLRYLVQDDPVAGEHAAQFFDARTPDDPAYLSTAVVIEAVGVMRRRYGIDQSQIRRLLETLLRSRDVVIESATSWRRAIDDSEQTNGDIADAIIALAALNAGADGVVTFDRRAQRLPGMLPVA
jgi:predicted nucleic-acid-binding protein